MFKSRSLKPTPAISHTGWVRRFLFSAVLAGLALSAFAVNETSAQPKKPPRRGAVETKTLSAGGFPIAITYYESVMGQDAPVVILLHMKDSNQLVWKRSFATQLQLRGYAVVTVDLRGHGASVPGGATAQGGKVTLRRGDYEAMVKLDLEAVKKFILEQHHLKKLNIRKTAIVAAEMSTPIAVVFAGLDWLKKPYPDAPDLASRTPRGQDIRALVLISPLESVPGVAASKALKGLRALGMPCMVAYGTGDSKDRNGRTAKKIFNLVTNKNAKVKITYLQAYPTKLRGTSMLGPKLKLETHMVTFLDKHLNKLTDPWVNRKSRLDR